MRLPQLSAVTVQSADAIELFIKAHPEAIEALVRKLAGSDPTMRDELLQSIRIALWQNDASRFGDEDAGLLLHRIDRRARDTRKVVRRQRRLGGKVVEAHGDMALLEANESEPICMRRARGERFDPQDPRTEDL